jgi:hypothetical protein
LAALWLSNWVSKYINFKREKLTNPKKNVDQITIFC